MALSACGPSSTSQRHESTPLGDVKPLHENATAAKIVEGAAGEAPLTATGANGRFVGREGCFSDLSRRWNVMIGRNANAPCDFDTEDGFALSFTMDVGAEGFAPLPKPGQTFEDRVYVEPQGPATGTYVEAKVEVLRHEKRYIVVKLTAKNGNLPPDLRAFGGVVRIRIRPEDEHWVVP